MKVEDAGDDAAAAAAARSKKSRIGQACISCGRRKTRCDGGLPCNSCVSIGKADLCVYGEKKKRGPPKGYSRTAKTDGSDAAGKKRRQSIDMSPSNPLVSSSVFASFGSSTMPYSSLRPSDLLNFPIGSLLMTGEPHPQTALRPQTSHSSDSQYSVKSPSLGQAASYASGESPKTATTTPDELQSSLFSSVPSLTSGIESAFISPVSNTPHPPFDPVASTSAQPYNPIPPQPWPTVDSYQATVPAFEPHPRPQSVSSLSGLPRDIRALMNSEDDLVDKQYWYNLAKKEVRESDESCIIYDTLDFDEVVPDNIADVLLEIFFIFIYPWFPIFCAPAPEFRTARYLKQWPILYNAILATAAPMCTKEVLLEHLSPEATLDEDRYNLSALSDLFYNRARYLFFKTNFEPSVSTVQSCLYIALRDYGQGRWRGVWHFVGLGSRMALDMGIDRSCDDPTVSAVDRQNQARAYWGCYVCDKFASCMGGRPAMLQLFDPELERPSPLGDEDTGVWITSGLHRFGIDESRFSNRPWLLMSTYSHFVRLTEIIEKVVALYSIRARKRDQLPDQTKLLLENHSMLFRNWKAACPPELTVTPGNSFQLPHVYNMHLWYNIALILLHRNFILSNIGLVHRGELQPSSHAICTAAAKDILDTVAQIKTNFGFHLTTSTAHFALFTACTIFIGNTTSLDKHRSADALLQYGECLCHLQEIAATWTTAGYHAEILQSLFDLTLQQTLVPPPGLNPDVDANPSLIPERTNALFWSRMPIGVDRAQWIAFETFYAQYCATTG